MISSRSESAFESAHASELGSASGRSTDRLLGAENETETETENKGAVASVTAYANAGESEVSKGTDRRLRGGYDWTSDNSSDVVPSRAPGRSTTVPSSDPRSALATRSRSQATRKPKRGPNPV